MEILSIILRKFKYSFSVLINSENEYFSYAVFGTTVNEKFDKVKLILS